MRNPDPQIEEAAAGSRLPQIEEAAAGSRLPQIEEAVAGSRQEIPDTESADPTGIGALATV